MKPIKNGQPQGPKNILLKAQQSGTNFIFDLAAEIDAGKYREGQKIHAKIVNRIKQCATATHIDGLYIAAHSTTQFNALDELVNKFARKKAPPVIGSTPIPDANKSTANVVAWCIMREIDFMRKKMFG